MTPHEALLIFRQAYHPLTTHRDIHLRQGYGGQAWAPKPLGEGGCLSTSVCRSQESKVLRGSATLVEEAPAGALESLVERTSHLRRDGAKAHPLCLGRSHFLLD